MGGLLAFNKKIKNLPQGDAIPLVTHIMAAYMETNTWDDAEEWCWDNATLNNHSKQQSRLYRKGYYLVGQFLDQDGRTVPPDRDALTGIETLEWYAITGAIQAKFRGKRLTYKETTEILLNNYITIGNNKIMLKNVNLRNIKSALRNPDREKSSGHLKLERLFGFQISLDVAKTIISKQSNVPRIRSYWFKFFNSITRANVHYDKFGIINDPKCTWCDASPQTREHLYIHCPVVRDFVSDITCARDIMQHYEQWLNGALDRAASWIMGETVYFLHASNYKRREINRATFLAGLGMKRDTELKIANDNLRFEQYDKKWASISRELGLPF